MSSRGFFLLLVLAACGAVRIQGQGLACGERKVKTVYLVQHGIEAKEGHWPWHTAIYHRNGREFEYVCGGSIVDGNTILTAAHCLFNHRGLLKLEDLSVQVGRNLLSEASLNSQEHAPRELIVHPDFNHQSVANDLALIRLATDITMTQYIQPVCLWSMSADQELIVGKNGTVVGFGLTEHDRVSDFLRQAALTVVDSWTCIESDREVYGNSLTSGMYCAGGRKGISACNGDSGGGMFFEQADTWFVRGIVSFMPLRENIGLCDGTKYTVFTDVAKYREWIEGYISPQTAYAPEDPILVDNSAKLRLLNFNKCGISSTANDSLQAHPWVGTIEVIRSDRNQTVMLCHATLISEWYALAPAHCFANDGFERIVRFGVFNRSMESECAQRPVGTTSLPCGQTMQIATIYKRPEYNAMAITDDMTLIQMRQPADLTLPNVRPICLPVTHALRSYQPKTYVEAGFFQGTTDIAERNLTFLNSVNCQQRFNEIGFPLRKSFTQTCTTSLPANHTGPCDQIMSGAPLETLQTFGGRERYFLHALLSFGSRECDPKVPDVHTNVAPYLEWILYNMKYIKQNAPDTREQLVFTK